VLRHNEKFALNLADDFANFTEVDNGYQLTEDGAESFVIQGYNQAIVFPNDKVPVGQRVALVIEPRQGC
jgi:succinylglutamate desuccinylase